ncbi:hypothetical protein ABK040_013407 [Willaertia magna]
MEKQQEFNEEVDEIEEDDKNTKNVDKTNNPIKEEEKEEAPIPQPPNAKEIIYTKIIQDGERYLDKENGIEYSYHADQNAWLPVVEESQFHNQQSIYDFIETEEMKNERLEKEKLLQLREYRKQQTKKRKKKEEGNKDNESIGWNESYNSSIYISNLPLDEKKVTNESLINEFSKCGIIKTDPFTQQPKVKIYRDENNNNQLKGDACITFLLEDSVDLAITLFDGATLFGNVIKVERAHFEKPENYDATRSLEYLQRRKQIQQKEKKKLKWGFSDDPDLDDNLLEFNPNERVVILKRMFKPEDFSTDPLFADDLKEEIKEECNKVGHVEKVKVYSENPEGVVEIRFKSPLHAKDCVKLFNGRWFDGQRISAYIWDGKESFKVEESEEQEEQRLKKYTEEYVLREGKGNNNKKSTIESEKK